MGVNYSEVIERMRWSGKLKNDSAVARALNVTPQALSNYKKRGEMPAHLIVQFAEAHGVSIDWLVTGLSPVTGGPEAPTLANIDPEEMVFIGKALRVLRGADKDKAMALRYSLDALDAAQGREAHHA